MFNNLPLDYAIPMFPEVGFQLPKKEKQGFVIFIFNHLLSLVEYIEINRDFIIFFLLSCSTSPLTCSKIENRFINTHNVSFLA